MSTPNPALDAAIEQFSKQPGVTAVEVSQLRATLASDPTLMGSLEKLASAGALNGFATTPPGAPNQPAGHFDPATRTMTLPASAFASSGSTASADLRGVLRVQSMVVDFGAKSFRDSAGALHPVTADMVANLQDTMNGSPTLAEQLKRAATTPAQTQPGQPPHHILESFGFTAPGAGVGVGRLSALVSDSSPTTRTTTPVGP